MRDFGFGTDLERPDAALLAAFGRSGEELVARARVVICLLLMIVPVYNMVVMPNEALHQLGLLVVLAATFVAVLILFLVVRSKYLRWLGLVSSITDVSLVSVALFLFLYTSGPEAAALSAQTFEIYFLTISATALRYDRRTCLIAGGIAVAQYLALLWSCAQVDASVLNPPMQVARIILLLSAVFLAWLLSRRAEELLLASNRDPVTGLGNRTFFDASARTEIARQLRRGRPCTLAIADVDHFKRFNDVHGHKVGDRVLRVIATTLRDRVRATDLVARWGGEEFVLFLTDSDCFDAARRLEVVRAAVAERPLETRKPPGHCTISIGVASSPGDGITLPELFEVADLRLLQAKQEGRDRVVGRPSCVAESGLINITPRSA